MEMTDQLFSDKREAILNKLDDIQSVANETKRSKDREIQSLANSIKEIEKKSKADEMEAKILHKDIIRYEQQLESLKNAIIKRKHLL
jgi:peptidoglycan hydrolase CwlO-like protein